MEDEVTVLGNDDETWPVDSLPQEAQDLQQGQSLSEGDTALTAGEPDVSALPPAPAGKAALVVPPPPVPAAGPRQTRRYRGLTIGLILASAILFLAFVAALVAVYAPGAWQRIGLARSATPTATVAGPLPTAPASEEAPTVTPLPTATPTPAASPIPAAEFDAQLADAGSLALRSRFEEAITIYQTLAENAPTDARPQSAWAWALLYDDRPEEALAHAQKAADLDPESADAATALARAYVGLENGAQALAQAERAVQLAPGQAEARAALAEAYRLNNQIEEAVREADLALVQDHDNANARSARAWLYQVADGDPARAAGELQSAAGLQPQLWLRRHELGRLLLVADNYGTAVLAFQDALNLRPKAVTYAALGEAYYGLEQFEQAAVSLRQAIAMGAQEAPTYGLIAAADANLSRCEEANGFVEKALALDPAEPLALEAQDLCRRGGPTPRPHTATPAAPSVTPAATPKPTRAAASLSGRIAFPVWNGARGKFDTYLAKAQDGSDRRLVLEEMHQPALSPDGKWLAVNGEQRDHMNLFIARPDGSSLTEITGYLEDGQPDWSPDGKRLVFASTRHGDKRFRIYIMDGVPFAGGQVEGRTLNYGPDDVRGQMPAWTSDDRIVYRGCTLDSPRSVCNGSGLFIMSAQPGPHKPKELTNQPGDSAPAVYGDKMAFMSNRDGNWEIYLMNLDGSGLKRLTDGPASDGLPTWSPDGRTIAFVSDQGGTWAIWAMNPDGTNRRKLFDVGGGGLAGDWLSEQIGWAP